MIHPGDSIRFQKSWIKAEMLLNPEQHNLLLISQDVIQHFQVLEI
jgi:hypothetical protein